MILVDTNVLLHDPATGATAAIDAPGVMQDALDGMRVDSMLHLQNPRAE